MNWPSSFFVACWYLWKRRNDCIFNQGKSGCVILVYFICMLFVIFKCEMYDV